MAFSMLRMGKKLGLVGDRIRLGAASTPGGLRQVICHMATNTPPGPLTGENAQQPSTELTALQIENLKNLKKIIGCIVTVAAIFGYGWYQDYCRDKILYQEAKEAREMYKWEHNL